MWGRLDVRRDLRTDDTQRNARGYKDGGANREATCLLRRYMLDNDVKIDRFSSGEWAPPKGVIQCNRWTCPACGKRRARSAASWLGVAMQRHMVAGEFHATPMLTQTIPHEAGCDSLTVDRLYAADEKFRKSVAWRRFAKRFGVVGRVRALDATHGGRNGSHPHFHSALFLTRATVPVGYAARPTKRKPEPRVVRDDLVTALIASGDSHSWQRAETDLAWLLGEPLRRVDVDTQASYLGELAGELVDAWAAACNDVGIAIRDLAAFKRHALTLSPCQDAAAYFVKWGLADEVGAPTAKHRSHLRLLDLVGARNREWSDRAGDCYIAFCEATKGKTWVAGLTDICRRVGVTEEDAAAYVEELQRRREKVLGPRPTVRELHLVVKNYLFPAAARLGWGRVLGFVDGLDEQCPQVDLQDALDQYLWRHLSDRERAPPN